MFVRNSVATCMLAAILQLTASRESAAQGDTPVQELRDRQQRLNNLEYAIKEAELLQRLCQLSPANPECADGSQETPAGAAEPTPASIRSYRLIGVIGAADHLQAVLVDPEGRQWTAKSGTELAPGLTVNRVRTDFVELVTPTGTSTLRIGEN